MSDEKESYLMSGECSGNSFVWGGGGQTEATLRPRSCCHRHKLALGKWPSFYRSIPVHTVLAADSWEGEGCNRTSLFALGMLQNCHEAINSNIFELCCTTFDQRQRWWCQPVSSSRKWPDGLIVGKE